MGGGAYKKVMADREAARTALLINARDLIAAGEFDAAERSVRGVDDSLEMDAMLARTYRECLRTAVAMGVSRDKVEAMFQRAKAAAWHAYPDPHTEIEADNYERGRAEDLATLVKIVGREPARAPSVRPGGAL
jgi:hypothetical protein